MHFNDFLAKIPVEKLIKVEILDNKIVLPIEIDLKQFYKDFSDDIKVVGLSTEKAIFAASLVDKQPYLDASTLLSSKLRFN